MLMTRRASALHVTGRWAANIDAIAAAADGSHAFLRSAWFVAAGPAALKLVTACREPGGPIAAVPFVRGSNPFAIAQVAGSYWPFRSFPIAADADASEIAAMLRGRSFRSALGPAWRLGPIYADDPTLARLRQAAPDGGWTILQRRLGTTFEIDVAGLTRSGTWPRAATLKKNRWREKGLQELGAVEYASFSGVTWRSDQRKAIARIEGRSWLAKLGTRADTQFLDSEQRRLWEAVAADPVLGSMLFCSILSVGGEPVAFTFGMEVGSVRYHIANNFDERFARHSPGKILLYKDFAAAAARGVARISWGSGDAGYKTDMGAQPGPEILDLLFVRPWLDLPLRRLWTGSFRMRAAGSAPSPV